MVWAFVLALLWLAGLFVLWRIPRCRSDPGAVGPPPSLSVLVPARDEAHNLPELLGSLAQQGLQPRELIVVDDQSSDLTAEVARRAGARVIAAGAPPAGWLGKPWACWQGAQGAAGEVLVFLDADVRLLPDGLARLAAEVRRRGGLVSVWPYHRMWRAYERLSAFFLLIVLAGMRAFTILGSRLPPLGAFGPCLAVSRADYFAAGGHAEVRHAILDDVALGRRFQAAGLPVACLRGEGTVEFRMYPLGLGSLVEGFGKNLASGFRAAGLAALLPAAGWIAGFFIAFGLTLIALALPGRPHLVVGLACYALYAASLAWQLRRLGNYGPLPAVLFPLPLFFFAGVFLYSLTRTFLFKAVRWKGRTIPLGGA